MGKRVLAIQVGYNDIRSFKPIFIVQKNRDFFPIFISFISRFVFTTH